MATEVATAVAMEVAAREGVESVAALAAKQAASVEAAGTSMKYQQT